VRANLNQSSFYALLVLMNMRKLCPYLYFVVMALLSQYAQAQIAPPPNYDQKLGDVVVNATRSGTPLDEMPLNTTILTKEALEISPDQTIDQVLKNVLMCEGWGMVAPWY
jgi:outer membrane cobalamin receptor